MFQAVAPADSNPALNSPEPIPQISRAALQRFLGAWQSVLQATRSEPAGKGLIRWAIDVDPLAI